MMPVGDGVVLVGMGERTTARAVSILAKNMFAAGAARLVIGAQMPRERAAMHLDTVFTFCDRDVATLYEPVVEQIRPILFRPGGDAGRAGRGLRALVPRRGRATRSGSTNLKLVTTGGDEFEAERNQWDDGNNVVALEPGVVVGYERNEATNAKLAKAGIEVLAIAGQELGTRTRRRPLHDLPDRPRAMSERRTTMSTMVDLRGRHLMKLADFTTGGVRLPARSRRRAEGGQARGP